MYILSLTRVSFYLYSSTVLFKFNMFNYVECLCYVDGLLLPEILFPICTSHFYLVLLFSLISFLYMDVTLPRFAQLHYSVNEILLNSVHFKN
jgi:hypothetical protein